MNKMLKYFLLRSIVPTFLVFLTGAASADVKDGKAAYDKQDYATALRELPDAAKSGSAEAQYLLGTMYETGLGTPKNPSEAAKYYLQAARRGNIEAQIRLSNAYANGEGVRQDPAISAYWQWKAAGEFATLEFQILGNERSADAKAYSSPKPGYIANSCRPPKYPPEAERFRQEGSIVFLFLVAPDGTALETSVAQSSGSELLDEAARSAFAKCKFYPRVKNGVPRLSVETLRYTFILR